MSKIYLIIPCYNEERRIPIPEYEAFLQQHKDTVLCFVNDGSTDGTDNVIESFCKKFPASSLLLSEKNNAGKAEAVRKGMLYCIANFEFGYIGYFDADLSTPLEECLKFKGYMESKGVEFCFGSRILKIGSTIERSSKRHYIGRIIATFISNILDLKVYDTQCGAKLFSKELAGKLFREPFVTTWLFDVELFARMLKMYGKQEALRKMLEVPLDRWINKEGSNVKVTYFFKLWLDMYRIKKALRVK